MPDDKTLDTLVEDIYSLLDPSADHVVSEENLEKAAQDFKDVLRASTRLREDPVDPLRFSSLGKQDRQIWHQSRGTEGEDMTPNTYLKFLYGHIIENMLLFLAKEAGHTVTDEQREIEVDGVLGHIDAIIDGVVVDVKSASPFGYQKFVNGNVITDDPFGYIKQLSGYSNVLTPDQAPAFIAMDKVSGNVTVMNVSTSITSDHKPEPRIAHLRDVIASDTPPPICYEPVPDGKSGNMKLDTGCSYCKYKKSCFPNARKFIYSNGPRYLTTVARMPKDTVLEIKDW